jgi:L-lactate permease
MTVQCPESEYINQETDSNLIMIVLSFITFFLKYTLPDITLCCCSMYSNNMFMIQEERKKKCSKAREREKKRKHWKEGRKKRAERKGGKKREDVIFLPFLLLYHIIDVICSLLFRIWMARSSVKQLGEFFDQNFSHSTLICKLFFDS